MADLFLVSLAAFLFEDDDLGGAALSDNGGRDVRTSHRRLTDLRGTVTADEEDLVKVDGRSHIARELFDRECLSLRDRILLATSLNNSVHASLHESAARLVNRPLPQVKSLMGLFSGDVELFEVIVGNTGNRHPPLDLPLEFL